MPSLLGTTWQFISTTQQFPTIDGNFEASEVMTATISDSPFPGPVTNLSGNWSEGPHHTSFSFTLSAENFGEISASGTHGKPDPRQGEGTITWIDGSQYPLFLMKVG